MTDKIFIDTNILVYAYVKDDEHKNKISCDLLRKNVMKENMNISVQVVSEFYSTMEKYKLPYEQIERYLREIIAQLKAKPLHLFTIERCLQIKKRYSYSWWDSLILSSAIENGCSIIYSEDMHNRQIIESSLKIVNPYL